MVYPAKIVSLLKRARFRPDAPSDAVGSDARFSCGSFTRIYLTVDSSDVVSGALFRSSGCGYMMAAATALTQLVEGKRLAELHGLPSGELEAVIRSELGDIPRDREDCVSTAIRATRAAFGDLRAKRIEEFRGESALICTCFGVTEERIENEIAVKGLRTVANVIEACNAGGGCGSCQMLIQDLLDRAGSYPLPEPP